MTIAAPEAKVTYEGSGSPGPFAFAFYFLADTDLLIIKDVAGVTSVLELTTDYTVTGAGDAAGGEVTLVVDLEADEFISIALDAPGTQLSEYVTGGPFPSETTEQGLDKLTMLAKQLTFGRYREAYRSIVSVANVLTIDLADNIGRYRCVMDENITSLVLSNPPPYGTAQRFIIEFIQDGTGSRTYLDGSATIKHAGGAPTLSTAANSEDHITYWAYPDGSARGIKALAFA